MIIILELHLLRVTFIHPLLKMHTQKLSFFSFFDTYSLNKLSVRNHSPSECSDQLL